ncbi:MAG TPA: hypothetical protein VFO67_11620, partial [Gemmatimonadales bacterium]|nr:hypothetical protein [Gemmatimonadales bacterium]
FDRGSRVSSLVPPEPTYAEPALARHVDAQRQGNSLTHADGRLSFCARTVVVGVRSHNRDAIEAEGPWTS